MKIGKDTPKRRIETEEFLLFRTTAPALTRMSSNLYFTTAHPPRPPHPLPIQNLTPYPFHHKPTSSYLHPNPGTLTYHLPIRTPLHPHPILSSFIRHFIPCPPVGVTHPRLQARFPFFLLSRDFLIFSSCLLQVDSH